MSEWKVREMSLSVAAVAFALLLTAAWRPATAEIAPPSVVPGDYTSETSLRERATEIMQQFGSNGVLSKSGLQAYLAGLTFSTVDTEKDGELTFDEWYAAYLYCDPTPTAGPETCPTDPATAGGRFSSQLNAADGKKLTAVTLPQVNSLWDEYLLVRTDAHWHMVASGAAGRWRIEALMEYLRAVDESLGRRAPVTERIGQLRKARGGASGNEVTLDQFIKFSRDEMFEAADRDRSGELDLYEAKAAFPADGFLNNFQMSSGSDLRISKAEFDGLNSTGGTIEAFIATKLQVAWNRITTERGRIGTPAVKTLETTEKDFLAHYQEESARIEKQIAAETEKAVSGVGLVPHRGLIISGNRRYDADEKRVEIDWSKPALALRLIQDFTKADDKALPADISITKNASQDSELSINAALRLDYYHPTLFDFADGHSLKPALGFQWNRSGNGDERQDVKRVFGLVDWFWSHGNGFWAASQFQIGPVYELDTKNDVKKFTGLIEYEPLLRLGRFATGVRIPLFGNSVDDLSIYVRPRLALELGDIVDEPSGSDTPDGNFFRYGGDVGFRLLKNLDITYSVRQYEGIDGDKEDHTFHKADLNWSLDSDKRYSVTFGYKKGENAPSFNDIEQYRAGLGVKF